MKEIMNRAWEIYRTLEGDHLAKLAMALRQAWAERKSSDSKLLEIAEWFTDKKAAENGMKIYSGHVVAVVAETEKAYKVIFSAVTHTMTFWAPKSLCKWVEARDFARTVIGTWEEGMAEHRAVRRLYV